MGNARRGAGRLRAAILRDGVRSALAVVATFALASCAAPPTADPGTPAPSGSRPGPGDPLALVGMWTLAGVNEGAGTVVGLTPADLTIYQDCGEVLASWSADGHGLFVGSVKGAAGGCDPVSRVGWLETAAAYRLDGDNAVLLDADGRTVARLLASGERPRPDRESFEVTDQARNSFGPAAALPARLTAAGRDKLAGRWLPVGAGRGTTKPPYLELGADGRWLGWDGCNGSGGGWVAGRAGTLLATAGFSTLVGCDGAPVQGWVSSARLAGFDGATLVLLDRDAKELGRLRRDGDRGTATPSSGN